VEEQRALVWVEALCLQDIADSYGRLSMVGNVLCSLGGRFEVNVVATQQSTFMRGMRALRATATVGNPLYAGALGDDEGVGQLWVEAIVALLSLGSPPSPLISHTFHAEIPSLAIFNTLAEFAGGDAAKKLAITRSKFGRVVAELPNLSSIVAGTDSCLQFGLAGQLMRALVSGG
jgi:hypothetical protein